MRAPIVTSLLLLPAMLILAGSLLSSPAWGQEKIPTRIAIKTGQLSHSDPAYEPAFNLGLTLGGSVLRRQYYHLGLELEITTSIIEGETRTGRGDWEMDSYALYSALRLGTRRGYLKLKAGYLDREIRYDDETALRERGPSWGIGIGLPLRNKRGLELEYTVMEDANNVEIHFISLAYLIH